MHPPDPERIAFSYEATGHAWVHAETPMRGELAPATLVAIHGYGQSPGQLLDFARVVAPGATLVVPEGPSRFYAGRRRPGRPRTEAGCAWIAGSDRQELDERNDALLAALLEHLGESHGRDPGRTVILGFSQGAGVAAHFGASYPDMAAGLVGLAGGIAEAYRPRLAALAGKDVLWINGVRDPAYPPDYTAKVLEAWREAGVHLTSHGLDTGHDLLDEAREEVRGWLAGRLG